MNFQEWQNYYINNPIFIKYRMALYSNGLKKIVKRTFINERIIEIPFVLQNIPQDTSIKILDLGCVESALSMHLASMGYKVTGVDIRNYPYKHPNFTFKDADILNLPFSEEEFDLVTCISTLEHIEIGYYNDLLMKNDIAEDVEKRAITQIARVLKKGGTLLFSVPFGRLRKTKHQKVYDSNYLNVFCKDFAIKIKKFFANFNKDGHNYWKEISEEEASKFVTRDNTTNCVCLLKMQK